MRLTEHKLFRWSIVIKGIFSIIETLSGFLVLMVDARAMRDFFANVLIHVLRFKPDSVIVNLFLNPNNYSHSFQLFAAIYLLSHGIIKFALIVGLWRRKKWVYPLSIAIFTLFTVYEIYKFIFTRSPFLLFLIILDVIVIILTILEYRNLRKEKYWSKKSP